MQALHAIRWIGPEDPAAVSAMIESLKDAGPDGIGLEAAIFLRDIGPPREAVPALIEALDLPGVSPGAVQALKEFGREAVSAIPAAKQQQFEEALKRWDDAMKADTPE